MIERNSTDGIETVRLAHGKANALDLELAVEIESTFRDLAENDAGAVILTGSGTIFSAGVDLFRVLEEGASYVLQFLPIFDSMIRAVFRLPKPLVCAVNGHAIAGGGLLALCGDVRLMGEGTGRIGLPELLVGVPFPPYALEIARLSMSPRGVERLVYSGATVGPEEAVELGLIDRAVPADALESKAREEAIGLAGIEREAFALTKAQLRSRADEIVKSLGSEAESRTMELWTSDATHRRIREYLDRTVGK